MPNFNGRRNTSIDKIFAFLRRHLLAIIVVIVVVSGIIATVMIVNRDDRPGDDDGGAIAILQPASEVRLAMYEPKSFNPLLSSDEDVVYINQLVYSYLFRLDNGLNIMPDIAESYVPNRETGSVEIVLKDDLIFSDGTAMNAYDVEYTIDTIKVIGETSPYYNYVKKISKVFVTSRNSLFIEFYSPKDAALDNLVFPIVSAESYRDYTFNVGGGPYKFGEYKAGKELILEANDKYYGEIPEISVVLSIVKNKEILPGLTTMDDVTAYISKEASADDVAIDKGLRCRYIPSGELEFIGFNCNNSILADSELRFAIASAIDRESIVKDDYANSGVVSDSLYFPNFLDVTAGEDVKYDPKKAAEILASLGYTDTNEDKVLENESGVPLSIRLLVRKDSGTRKDAAATIAKNLNAIGINVEVIQLASEEMTAVLKGGSFDMYLGGIKLDKQFKMTELFTSANYGRYDDETVLTLVSQLEQCLSREEQKGVFTVLKPLLNKELPYFSICYKTHSFVSVSSLAVKDGPTFFDPYRDIQHWSWQKKVTTEE